ncbi:unnamed protein product [Medioppia subpectinata]|uniref:protein-tyrosine-phosphatase n=1 Tax=Medioppia subpectinata TaxID=1979941 RepID=A0A7R9Q3I5_9ACAR|nr:unnamed protein product [Medioppia subpectinata]CAG2111311.1 unnamed protein product [Medioppia subpectinata]
MNSRWTRWSVLGIPYESADNDYTPIDAEKTLFVGNKEVAHNRYTLQTLAITLMVAVCAKDMTALAVDLRPDNCRFHHIDAEDSPHEDLMAHFDRAVDLIDEELVDRGGRVMVWCGAGWSRSVTIVAAYLMRRDRCTGDEALELIRRVRPKINPNAGFVAQLRLYHEMNYRLDVTHREYRVFAVIALRRRVWTDKYWSDTRVGALQRQFSEPMRRYFHKMAKSVAKRESPPVVAITGAKTGRYHCRDCDGVVADELNVLRTADADSGHGSGAEECDKMFVEPMEWMLPSICVQKKGDLLCGNCSVPLGAFKWKAFKCDCLLHQPLQDSTVFKIMKTQVVYK